MQDIWELKRQGPSVQAIGNVMGIDRKTVRKYLRQPGGAPAYGPRAPRDSKLDAIKPYPEQRLGAGVWNAQVRLRELRQRGYSGGYTILTDRLHPQRAAASVVAVRRFETLPGEQAQVDWEHLGGLEIDGQVRKLWGFAFTLGYSRMMMAAPALDRKLRTLLRMHEEAFRQVGAVPHEILFDRMRTVWQGADERGEVIWNAVFLDFARYWGFQPRLCRSYRAQTKGKLESGVKYVRRNFLCGLQRREPANIEDLNAQLREWVWTVANQRVHGMTHEVVMTRWDSDRFALQPLDGRPPYAYADDEQCKVARDVYVHWQGSRYSVPWAYAAKQVWVRQIEGRVEVLHAARCMAEHSAAPRKHLVICSREHLEGIPLGARQNRKTLAHIRQAAPAVEVRPLEAYESVALKGGR